MKKIKLGVIYPMPKEYGVSIRLNRLVSKLSGNFEVHEIVQEKWNESYPGKILFTLKQIIMALHGKFNPDVIYAPAPLITSVIPALLIKNIKKSPLLLDWDDCYYDFRKFKPPFWHKVYWEYHAVKSADAIIVVSKNLKDTAEKLRNSDKNIFYIPNGIDISLFSPKKYDAKKLRKRFGINKNDVVIFFVGHIGRSGNRFVGKELADAACSLTRKYGNLKFFVAGYGGGVELLKQYVKDKNLEKFYVFADMLTELEVPKFINIGDICIDVIPEHVTPNFYNRSSMKLKEYMAMQKPVVAFCAGENIVDLENGKCGILIYSHKKIGHAIEKLIKNPNLRKKYGRLARNRIIKYYNLKQQTKHLEKIIVRIYDERNKN